jgi:hypothetical protein
MAGTTRYRGTRHRLGLIKIMARAWEAGWPPIPIFVSSSLNRAIDAHARRIRQAKTRKRRSDVRDRGRPFST